jgi:hypothetical protein
MIRRLALALTLPLLVVSLCGFTPFTRVTNVCPKCKAPRTDIVTLTNGFRVLGNVVAQNQSFFVVERFGEYRPVMKNEVSKVQWKDRGGPSNLGTGDQVLLKNNVVLHGAITAEDVGRYLIIQVGPLKHVVWNSQIQSIFKGGLLYTPPR